jgi:hypothetical protein
MLPLALSVTAEVTFTLQHSIISMLICVIDCLLLYRKTGDLMILRSYNDSTITLPAC